MLVLSVKRIIVDATLRREPRIDFQTAQTAQAARLDDLDDEAVFCRVWRNEPGSASGYPSERLDRRGCRNADCRLGEDHRKVNSLQFEVRAGLRGSARNQTVR